MATFLEMIIGPGEDTSIARARYFVYAWHKCVNKHASLAVQLKADGDDEQAQWHLARAARAWARLQQAREVGRKLWEAQGKGNKYEH